jgi:hypothetical protein
MIGFALNFTIESALFNDFLHEEAIQLSLNTLKVSRKYLSCQQHKWLYERAKKFNLATGTGYHATWGWMNPWSKDTFEWIWKTADERLRNMAPSC